MMEILASKIYANLHRIRTFVDVFEVLYCFFNFWKRRPETNKKYKVKGNYADIDVSGYGNGIFIKKKFQKKCEDKD
ncbi:hypothetical protein DERF_000647 [Dermatophagoides farinae]|uniref:Uncharacterized protein n=1 Tax=Dermatophagoides farinae TaxID=6954 RepID=A0A922LAD9_DERFA|nr:hypothetical protein DERF_000647 [Dermatophagoides farinae]